MTCRTVWPHRAALSRRSLVGLAAAIPFAAAASAASIADESLLPSLNQEAGRAGLLFGSASETRIADAPEAYGGLFRHHCGLFAPIMSWQKTAPSRDGDDPAWEDPNVAFARRNGMRLTGAHFLWYYRTPEWFARIETPAEAQAAVDRHIARMAVRYAGSVFSWNVVNEEIDTLHGGTDGLRLSPYRRKLGPDFMAAAFRAARAADPNALLIYNDGDLEMDTPYQAARRDALMRLLDRLQRASAPIDGVGLQSHLRVDGTRFDPGLYARFLHDIAARGLKILITELDVFDQRADPAIDARDASVADRYAAFLAVALAEPAVKSVVTWGLSDRFTWINAWLTPERAAKYGRPYGLPARALPFDADFQAKPAYFAILGALRNAPKRRAAT